MMQNNETSSSFVPNEVDQTQANHEYLNHDANTNQQASAFTLCNPTKKQKKTKATKKPDEQFAPQQNWAYNASESSSVQPPNLPSAFTRTKPTPDHRPNHHGNQAHQAHVHQFFNISSGPPQIPLQSMQHPLSMPYNTFSQYYQPLQYVKYNQFPQHHSQYPQHSSQFAQHRMQAMQAMMPAPYPLDPNIPATATSDTQATSSYAYTGQESQSRRYDTVSPTNWSQQAPNAETGSTDSQGLKRRNCGDEMAAAQGCKRPRSLTSAGNDSTPSSSPYSAQSNDVKEESAEKKALDPSHVIEERYDFSCVICQEIRKDTVLFPCRHLCVCEKCSENITLCPLCRKKFHETLTVYT